MGHVTKSYLFVIDQNFHVVPSFMQTAVISPFQFYFAVSPSNFYSPLYFHFTVPYSPFYFYSPFHFYLPFYMLLSRLSQRHGCHHRCTANKIDNKYEVNSKFYFYSPFHFYLP